MTQTKALAVQALLLTGAVVRIELRKAGTADPDVWFWWLGHLDTIVEVLRPSAICRRAVQDLDPVHKLSWYATDEYL